MIDDETDEMETTDGRSSSMSQIEEIMESVSDVLSTQTITDKENIT